jgi:hypothetical protein
MSSLMADLPARFALPPCETTGACFAQGDTGLHVVGGIAEQGIRDIEGTHEVGASGLVDDHRVAPESAAVDDSHRVENLLTMRLQAFWKGRGRWNVSVRPGPH